MSNAAPEPRATPPGATASADATAGASASAGASAGASANVTASSAAGAQGSASPLGRRRRRNPLIYFWVYSLARVSLYLVLWGLLWLFGLGGLIGAAVALVLSVPLSLVLLSRPRAAMTASMMERLNVRQERTAALDQELSGDGLSGDEHSGDGLSGDGLPGDGLPGDGARSE